MNKQEIYEAVQKLLFSDTRDLSRSEYKELLQDINSECLDMLRAMEEDDQQ